MPSATTPPAEADTPDADRGPLGATMRSRVGYLLGIVRSLMFWGKEIAARLEHCAGTPAFTSFVRPFGTAALPLILARIARGLLLAAALEARLRRRLESGGDITPSRPRELYAACAGGRGPAGRATPSSPDTNAGSVWPAHGRANRQGHPAPPGWRGDRRYLRRVRYESRTMRPRPLAGTGVRHHHVRRQHRPLAATDEKADQGGVHRAIGCAGASAILGAPARAGGCRHGTAARRGYANRRRMTNGASPWLAPASRFRT